MKTQLLAAIVALIAFPLRANPVPDPVYELVSENVNVKTGFGKSKITATYRFSMSAATSCKHLSVFDFDKLRREKGKDGWRHYQTKIYFPVYLPEVWKHDAHAMRTIRFKAVLYRRYSRRRIRIREMFIERSDGNHLADRGKMPAVKGVKPMWLQMKLRSGPLSSPSSFEIDIRYDQPNAMQGKTPIFSYMPLLPADHKPSLRFTMTVESADQKPVTVLNGTNGGIFRKDKKFIIQLSDEKVVRVAYGKEDPALKMIPKLALVKK